MSNRKMTRHGVTVVGNAGFYVTPDGRYEVARVDDYETECSEPHPVKLPRSEWKHGYRYDDVGNYVNVLIKGYHCEGGETHFYTRWHIWDQQEGDYAFGDSPGEYETFDEAMESLAKNLAAENSSATTESVN